MPSRTSAPTKGASRGGVIRRHPGQIPDFPTKDLWAYL